MRTRIRLVLAVLTLLVVANFVYAMRMRGVPQTGGCGVVVTADGATAAQGTELSADEQR